MEPEFEIISKIEAALVQLGDAIDFYYSWKFVSAITLAGAAEEIFSRLGSELLGGKTRMDSADITATMMAMTMHGHEDINSLKLAEKEKLIGEMKKDFLTENNRVRNELKHKTFTDENYVVAGSFKEIAHMHIGSAISNIIISRTRLPFRSTQIDRFCNIEGLSNPYLTKENWGAGD